MRISGSPDASHYSALPAKTQACALLFLAVHVPQRDPAAVARALDAAIVRQLEALRGLSREELLAQRYARYRAF